MFSPIKEIVPREVPEKAKPTLEWFCKILNETVDFGSNIMLWDANPKTNGEENVPPTMLLRHFIDIIDSISLLVKEGSGDTAKILARAALEVTLYMEYLFEKDSKKRAMAFLVEDTMKQIKIANKLNPDLPEGKQTYRLFNDEKLLTDAVADPKQMFSFVQEKKKLLQLPRFQEAYKEYQRLIRKGERNPKWYSFYDGPKNIESLASYLRQKTLYEIIYRKWSGSVHGTDIYVGKMNTYPEENRIDIFQIRFIKDVQEVVSYSLIMSFKIFSRYILTRIPERQENYFKWYKYMGSYKENLAKKQYINIAD